MAPSPSRTFLSQTRKAALAPLQLCCATFFNRVTYVLACHKEMNLVRNWIGGFPELQKDAILDALKSVSLAKVRRALRLLEKLGPDQRGPILNLELLSTFNLEPVLPVLQLALDCLPTRANLRLAPLDAIEAHISQHANSQSREFPHARVIIWRLEELLPEALYPFSSGFPDQLASRVDQVLDRIEQVVSVHQKNARGVPLFLSTVMIPVHSSNQVFAAQHRCGLFGLVGRLTQKIYELATANSSVHVLDLARWAALEGRTHADATLDFMARQPLSAKGQVAVSLFLARCVRPLIVPARKALAIDLDNTLWGGVVGEDGIAGLKLGHDFPGNVHLRIQRELFELKTKGVLLVLLSKNNEADAREAFDSLPDILLKWEDFAVRKVNWNHKHENLRDAARELRLGLDSFAFIDDSDYEREQMHQFIPEVLILNESSDPLHTLRSLWETDAFDSLTVTEEDRLRHPDYAVRAARDVEAHQDDLEAFLKSLEMEATIEEIGPSNVDRALAMIGKTNQFNLTTRRHTRAQLQAMLEAPGSIALALRLRDKFGDQGIVALLLAIPAGENATLAIDTFLVSCRALGRGVEDALWAALMNQVNRQKVQKLEAEYLVTAKNGIVADLYDRLGLQRIKQNSSSTRYQLEPVRDYPFVPWINLVMKSDGQ
jgi:FkbH-like protein